MRLALPVAVAACVAVLSGCALPVNSYTPSPRTQILLRSANVSVTLLAVTAKQEDDTCRLAPLPRGSFTKLSDMVAHGIEVETVGANVLAGRPVSLRVDLTLFSIDCTNRSASIKIAGHATANGATAPISVSVPIEYFFFGGLMHESATRGVDEAVRLVVRQALQTAPIAP